jgi:hypothetical protein
MIPKILAAALLFAVIGGSSLEAESPIRSGDQVAIVGNTFADQLRIHGYLETLLTRHADVSVRNLGWGGDMLTARDRPTGFPSEESTLTAHKTDVIVACFGMGESFAGAGGIEEFKRDLSAFIASHRDKKYNGETAVRLVLVSPIAYEDLGKRTPALDSRNGDLKAYTRAMGEVAAAADTPFVDLFEASRYLMGESKVAKLTTNGIHLNALGYWAMSHAFFEGLVGETNPQWRLIIDAEAITGSATGVKLADLIADAEGLNMTVTETSAPSLPPPGDAELPLQLSSQRDTLIVKNLKPGEYTLSIDGEKVIGARHDAWARGVAIDASPAHREAAALREAINDKNRQFTYSWKALNQVHIVGERRNSPSGRALPAEVIEFNKLALQRDKEIRSMTKLKTRQWRLEVTK